RLPYRFRIQRERAKKIRLAFVHEHGEIDLIEPEACHAALARLPLDRGDASVRVLHVVDGVLHRLRRDDIQIECLRRVDALEQEGQPRDGGGELVAGGWWRDE